MSELRVEKATAAHNKAILEIYNDVLEKTPAIYEDQPRTLEGQAEWMAMREQGKYPTFVAMLDDRVVGFAFFSQFRVKEGYRGTAELTLHLSAEMRGRGIGSNLMAFLEKEAREREYHVLISAIDEENRISRRLHERAGFSAVGTLPEIATLRGAWRNLMLYQKILR